VRQEKSEGQKERYSVCHDSCSNQLIEVVNREGVLVKEKTLFCPSLKMSLIRVQLWWREVKYIIYSSPNELKYFCMLLQELIKEFLWSNLHCCVLVALSGPYWFMICFSKLGNLSIYAQQVM